MGECHPHWGNICWLLSPSVTFCHGSGSTSTKLVMLNTRSPLVPLYSNYDHETAANAQVGVHVCGVIDVGQGLMYLVHTAPRFQNAVPATCQSVKHTLTLPELSMEAMMRDSLT
jgi:hypothetical protein